MAQPLPSSLSAILTNIKGQLLATIPACVTGACSVWIVARSDPKRFRGGQHILLRPGTISWDRGFDAGSGRICPIIRRPLLVHLRTRLNVDPSDDDTLRLTDPTNGHLALEESVCDVLLDYLPTDGNGNWLVQEPMHPLDYPQEEERQEPAVRDWVETNLAFQLTYQPPLTQTGPSY